MSTNFFVKMLESIILGMNFSEFLSNVKPNREVSNAHSRGFPQWQPILDIIDCVTLCDLALYKRASRTVVTVIVTPAVTP